jgi:RNA polymerase sigma factor (sigma-70 family)
MFQPPPDDESWFRALLEGDQKAYRTFFDRHVAFVKMQIEYIVKDEPIAEELTSDAFVITWNYRLWAASHADLQNILYAMAKLMVFIYLISEKAEKPDRYLVEQLYYQSEPTEGDRRKAHLLEQVYLRVENLPERQKEVLELRYLKGFSNEEIAEQLEISPYTVRNHLAKALKNLRDFAYREHLLIFVILLRTLVKTIIIW